MKLNQEFLIHHSGKEDVLVPTGNADFSGVVRGNRTFGTIVTLLKEETTEEAVVDAVKAQYDAPEGAIEKDVHEILKVLRQIHALDE